MDGKQFLAEFGHIASAPGGVRRLREMIYQLAVTGSLADQVSGAKEVLNDIEKRRKKLITEKKYKRLPKLEEESFGLGKNINIPEGWVWTRLLDVGEISPKNKIEDEDSECLADFLPMSGISESHKAALHSEVRPWEKIKKGYTHFANNDVAIAKITPCFENGKATVIRNLDSRAGIGAGTTELHVFRPIHDGVLPDYVYIFLRSPYFRVEGEKNMSGTAGQKRVPTAFFATYPFPLPSPEEQSLIVAKVDELMLLCDQLEAQQQQKSNLQRHLRQAVLQSLASAETPKGLQNGWERFAENFSHLFSKTEDVDELRNLIMKLGVSGRLTNPESSDSPALHLLEKIKYSKKKGVESGVIKKLRPVIGSPLKQTLIPAHWTQLILDDAISMMDAGWSPKCLSHPQNGNDTWGVLKTTAVQRLKFLSIENKQLPSSLEARPQYETKVGDILVTRAGPSNRVGICCVVDHASPKLMISDKIIRFRIVDELIEAEFVALLLSAGEVGKILESKKSGMASSQMNITQNRLRSIPILLPPKEEQKRILDKIQELLNFCDTLEEKLHLADETAEHLAAAAITSLTGITIPQQEAPMKASKTELKAPVLLGRSEPASNDKAPLTTLLTRHNGEMGAHDLWQRFGGEIDIFYAQLKTEVINGWIAEPCDAKMLEKDVD